MSKRAQSVIEMVEGDITGILVPRVPPGTGPRSEVGPGYTSRPGVQSRVWARVINGTLYQFTAIRMENGERRYVVQKYNGYLGGLHFACAWTQVKFITVPSQKVQVPEKSEKWPWDGCPDCNRQAGQIHTIQCGVHDW